MTKLYLKLNMFTLNQKVFIYENDEIKEICYVLLSHAAEDLDKICKSRHVEVVELDGNANYLFKLKHKLEKQAMFNNHNYTVTIV